MDENRFEDGIEENPNAIDRADVVVGIPSLNEAANIASPTRVADQGLRRFFPDKRGVIVNCDNRSTDGTRETFLAVPTETPKVYLATPEGIRGKGHNLLNLFQRCREWGVGGIVVIDADARNVSEAWVGNLMEPLFKGFDLVTPVYVRNRYEGALTNNVLYPMTRCLFGKRVRDPSGGEFGVSASLAERLLAEDLPACVTGFGIDMWMTCTAIASGLPVSQAFLGSSKGHRSDDPEAPGSLRVFGDLMQTVFLLIERFHPVWKKVRWSKPTAIFNASSCREEDPSGIIFDPPALHRRFLEGFATHGGIWNEILHMDVLKKLQEVRSMPLETFEFPALMWALILFDFAVAHKQGAREPQALLDALLPLYLGITCSYTLSTAHMSPQQVEVYTDKLCRVFEETKPYLDYLWEKR